MLTVCTNGHMYQDTFLSCPTCLDNTGEQALLDAQPEFLRKAAKGDYALRIVKIGGNKHTLLFTSYTRTFCGTTLATGKSKKTGKALLPSVTYETWTTELMGKLCPGCRSALTRALEAAA